MKSKGPKKIEIRRAFLLTASDQGSAVSGQVTATKAEGTKDEKLPVKKSEDDEEMEEELAGISHEHYLGEAVGYI